jgi:diacylglycerol kinase family enzyme
MVAGDDRRSVAPSMRAGSSRALVLVNRDAGAVLENSSSLAQSIEQAFGAAGVSARVRFVPAGELTGAFRAAAAAANGEPPELIVIAGGDGTINALLPQLMDTSVRTAILPLGTLNLIGRDLGLSGALEADAAAIAGGGDVRIDIVSVNGRPFHSNAGLGFFTTMARERQLARRRFPFSRKLGFAWAAIRTVLTTSPIEIECRAAGEVTHATADAVLVTNNRFFGAGWTRRRLDEGVLEVHLLKATGLAGRLRAAVAVMRGAWRELPSLTTVAATEVVIRRRRRTRVRVAMDGELVVLDNPLVFRVMARAVTLRSAGTTMP